MTLSRILIAEDDVQLGESLAEALELAGYTASTVSNGLAAWELLQDEAFDVFITDDLMPFMDGRTLITNIHGTPSLDGLLVILISGYDNISTSAYQRLDYVLRKPFDITDILNIIQHHSK